MSIAVKTILYLLYVIFVGTLIFGIVHEFRAPVPMPPQQTTTPHSQVSKSGSTQTPPTGSKSSSGASSQSKQSATSASTPASSTPLANTGPGSVVGIFGLSSIAGAWLYRRTLLLRINRARTYR